MEPLTIFQHEVQQDQQALTFQPPPGAEITGSPTPTLPRQAELFLWEWPPQGTTETGDHSNQILSSTSMNNLSDTSMANPYAQGSSSTFSPMPSLNLQASLPGKSQLFICIPELRPGLRALATTNTTFSDEYSFIPKRLVLALSSLSSTDSHTSCGRWSVHASVPTRFFIFEAITYHHAAYGNACVSGTMLLRVSVHT
jgi:hypothetical protein